MQWETRTRRASLSTFTWPDAWKEFTSGGQRRRRQVPRCLPGLRYAAPTAPERFPPEPATSWGRPAKLAEPASRALGIPLPAGTAPWGPGAELIATQSNTTAQGASASWSRSRSARPFLRIVRAPSFSKLAGPERPEKDTVLVAWYLAIRTRPREMPAATPRTRAARVGARRRPKIICGKLTLAQSRPKRLHVPTCSKVKDVCVVFLFHV